MVVKAGSTDTARTWYVRDASGNVMSVYESGKPALHDGRLTQSELHLYGSSRLGLLRRSVDVVSAYNPADTVMPLLGTGLSLTFGRGDKLFELSNHLGNVLVTLNDKKIGLSSPSNSSLIDHYEPQVVSAQDYYPFGMLQPGRSNNVGGYRYGFNGKEMDNEVKGEGEQQDYGMRVYDPRIGKFLSVDPLTKDYPWYTPYQFAGNNPVKYIDLDGAEQFDPESVPKGITHLSVATTPGVYAQTKSIWIGNYELRGMIGENRVPYWIARYHYPDKDKDGNIIGWYNDEWVVGRGGIKDLAKDPEGYHNKSEWIWKLGVNPLNVSTLIDGWKEQVSNPINWITGAGILASSYKGLLRGTVSTVQAREWYLANEAEIPNMINTKLPLEEQAKQAFNLRNQIRTEARELMADRAKAAELYKKDPNLTWEQILEKYKGKSGDELWQEIINSSQRSRPSVNKSLGLDDKGKK